MEVLLLIVIALQCVILMQRVCSPRGRASGHPGAGLSEVESRLEREIEDVRSRLAHDSEHGDGHEVEILSLQLKRLQGWHSFVRRLRRLL